MPDQPVVTINADRAIAAFTQMAGQLRDLRPVFREFHVYHAREIDSVFRTLGRGGTTREITWRDFAPSSLPHARQRDGRRSYGRRGGTAPLARSQRSTGPMTLGAMRPSGQRLTLRSKLLQDTGALRASASTGVFMLTKDALAYGSDKDYAANVAKTHPWYTFTEQDGEMLLKITEKALTAQRRGE